MLKFFVVNVYVNRMRCGWRRRWIHCKSKEVKYQQDIYIHNFAYHFPRIKTQSTRKRRNKTRNTTSVWRRRRRLKWKLMTFRWHLLKYYSNRTTNAVFFSFSAVLLWFTAAGYPMQVQHKMNTNLKVKKYGWRIYCSRAHNIRTLISICDPIIRMDVMRRLSIVFRVHCEQARG